MDRHQKRREGEEEERDWQLRPNSSWRSSRCRWSGIGGGVTVHSLWSSNTSHQLERNRATENWTWLPSHCQHLMKLFFKKNKNCKRENKISQTRTSESGEGAHFQMVAPSRHIWHERSCGCKHVRAVTVQKVDWVKLLSWKFGSCYSKPMSTNPKMPSGGIFRQSDATKPRAEVICARTSTKRKRTEWLLL